MGSLILTILVNSIWDKVFKNRPSKICGRQPLKNFTWSILEYFVPYKPFPFRTNMKLHNISITPKMVKNVITTFGSTMASDPDSILEEL